MKDLMNTEIDTTEMHKLIGLLCLAEIPHEITECWGTPQVWYPSAEEHVCDVICHSGSYGHEEGLLEIMGLVDEDHGDDVEGYLGDDVEGYLTALEVFRRILNDYTSK